MKVALAALLICGVSMLVLYAIIRSEERQLDKTRKPPAPTADSSRNN